MGRKAKGFIWILSMGSILVLFLPQWGGSYGKKLEVTPEEARVYLKPQESSTVIGILERGKKVTLGSSTKIKKCWFYVYFSSEDSEITRSGYMRDSSVKKLFQVTQTITLKGGESTEKKKTDKQFRQTYWGMSRREVVDVEGPPDKQKKSGGLGVITYQQRLMNRDCVLEYVFAEDKLAAAKYEFISSHLGENRGIQDYMSLKKMLVQKYGKPYQDEIKWDSSSDKKSPCKGKALVSGELRYEASWRTPKTEISLHLYGERGQVNLEIEYKGLQYKEMARKAAQESLLSLL